MTSTQDNLKIGFAGESQANQKYRAFAKKAEQEDLPNIARLTTRCSQPRGICDLLSIVLKFG
jgi:rubrerythrin